MFFFFKVAEMKFAPSMGDDHKIQKKSGSSTMTILFLSSLATQLNYGCFSLWGYNSAWLIQT